MMAEALVSITSRSKVYFPDSGQTKGDLADYYAAVAPLMLRHAEGRPLSILRCPHGRSTRCFFQRHDTGGFGPHVGRVPIREKSGEVEDNLYLTGAAALLECVQLGTIEFHLWGSRVEDVEAPDRMVFDLDPGEGVGFAQVCSAAADILDLLSEMGLVSFPMLTGGKGVHVVVPLTPRHSWDRHTGFARALAQMLAAGQPERFTASSSKDERQGRIFIDYLRNARGNSAIAPYSARARSGAPVAAPVSWDELPKMESASHFHMADAVLLEKRAAAAELSGWGVAEQVLPERDPS